MPSKNVALRLANRGTTSPRRRFKTAVSNFKSWREHDMATTPRRRIIRPVIPLHYYLAEAQLLEQCFEEPMVHFTRDEAPAFLFPAVQEFSNSQPASQTKTCYV